MYRCTYSKDAGTRFFNDKSMRDRYEKVQSLPNVHIDRQHAREEQYYLVLGRSRKEAVHKFVAQFDRVCATNRLSAARRQTHGPRDR